jgi:hypothetical protein
LLQRGAQPGKQQVWFPGHPPQQSLAGLHSQIDFWQMSRLLAQTLPGQHG